MRVSPRSQAFAAAVAAALATAGCTGDGPPPVEPIPSASSTTAAMTFEEAHGKLPMNGTGSSPITWDLAGAPETAEVLAARRSLVFRYWQDSATDWAPITPLGRYLFTQEYYDSILAPLETSTTDDPAIGPVWVKVMGVEADGADRATVTFCTDLGHWRDTTAKPEVREDRANLESYDLKYVDTGDGDRRWLTDARIANDGPRVPEYGTQCEEWARHQP